MHRPKRVWRARAFLLPAGLAVTVGFAGAEAAGCFDSLDDCSNTLYFGPACVGAGSMGSTGSSSGTGSTGSTGSAGSSSGTGAGGTSASASASSGGTGGKAGCTKPSECPAVPPGPCASLGTATCTEGKCGVKYTAGPAPSQQYGSCLQNVCDTTGNLFVNANTSNTFNNGDPCMPGTCTAADKPENNPTLGAVCTLSGTSGGMGICEPNPDNTNTGLTVCWACDPSSTTACIQGVSVCVGGGCAPGHCADNAEDNGETDVDCGGVTGCPACQVGQKCMVYSDCFSQVCEAPDGGQLRCQQPSCSDGVQNGAETDRDCGGSCSPCGNTLKCLNPADCMSGVCLPTTAGMPDRCAAPTCTDGVENGNETGIDCSGGGGCPPCNDAGL